MPSYSVLFPLAPNPNAPYYYASQRESLSLQVSDQRFQLPFICESFTRPWDFCPGNGFPFIPPFTQLFPFFTAHMTLLGMLTGAALCYFTPQKYVSKDPCCCYVIQTLRETDQFSGMKCQHSPSPHKINGTIVLPGLPRWVPFAFRQMLIIPQFGKYGQKNLQKINGRCLKLSNKPMYVPCSARHIFLRSF